MAATRMSEESWKFINFACFFNILLHNCNCIAIANVGISLHMTVIHDIPSQSKSPQRPARSCQKARNALCGYVATV